MGLEKEKRNLSSIYFRHLNKDTNKWENRTFEDLSTSDQEELLKDKDEEYLKRLIIALASVINDLGDTFDLISE